MWDLAQITNFPQWSRTCSITWEDQAAGRWQTNSADSKPVGIFHGALHDGRSVALWVCFRNQGQLQVDMQNAKFNHGAFV